MRSFGATFGGLAVAVLGLSIGIGRAQGGLQEPAARIIDLELSELEIGKAVAYLFAKVNGKYSLASDVKGVTTVSLKSVRFEDALANVLRQVNATWRIKDGVYEIVLKPQPEIDLAPYESADREQFGEDVRVVLARLFGKVGVPYFISPEVQGRVRISESDLKGLTYEAGLQVVLKQANATYRVNGGVYEIVPQDQGQKIVDIQADDEGIREVLHRLFKTIGVSYSIAPEVQGNVTTQLRGVSFDSALANVLKQVDATYRIEGGIYMIVKPRIRIGGGPIDSPMIVRESENEPSPVITMDDRHLYILVGRRLYKVNKSDLKTVVSSMDIGPDPRNQLTVMGTEPSKRAAMAADGRYLYILRGANLSKVNKSDLKVLVARKLGE